MKDTDEKFDEKIHDKIETDEENAMAGMDDESQGGDLSESKVGLKYNKKFNFLIMLVLNY